MWKATFIFIARFGGGGLVGYAAPRFLIASGVPLDTWIKDLAYKFKDASAWINYDSIYWVLVLIIGLFVISLTYLIPYFLSKQKQEKVAEIIEPPPKTKETNEYTLMSDVARIAYEKHRTQDDYESAIAAFNEGFGSNNDDVLNALALAISVASEVDLFGKHDPSTVFEKIPLNVENNFVFRSRGNALHPMGNDTPQYLDVSIKSGDLDTAINSINENEYEYISLDEAAIKAYEEGRNTIMATAAESATKFHQPNPKEYFAQWLIGTNDNPKMKVYGCKHQLNICDEIPRTEIYGNDLKTNDKGELVLKDRTYKHIKYHKLCVKRKEFNNRLTEIRERFSDGNR